MRSRVQDSRVTSPRRAASATASRREWAPSFRSTACTCARRVAVDMPSDSAAALVLVPLDDRRLHVVDDGEHLDPFGRAKRDTQELGEEPLVVDDDDADGLSHQRSPPDRTLLASAATTAASSSPRATAL